MKLHLALALPLALWWAPATLAQQPDVLAPAGPVPINPVNWVTTADRVRSGSQGEGITKFELTVSPRGVVDRCSVTGSSSFAALDELTCSLMMNRGCFHPATDQNGLPIASTFNNQVKWARPGHDIIGSTPRPYLLLNVSQLPQHISNPTFVHVLAVIGREGEVEACEGQAKGEGAPLNRVACKQLGAHAPDLTSRDNAGRPQRVLRSLLVEFLAG